MKPTKVYATRREVDLILQFLSGQLKEGSNENLNARRALARLLRRPEQRLDLGLRWALAELFDPDPPPLVDGEGHCGKDDEQPFIIHLKRRRRGKPAKETVAERDIAVFIWDRHGKRQMRDIVRAATKKFGPKRTQILKIWEKWQPILKWQFRAERSSAIFSIKADLL